ncbi:ATP-binding protein [Mycolicibacter minnesotensis]
MTDIESDRTTPPCGERAVELRVAPRLESLAVVRMLVGAMAAFEDLDVDRVADLRLAIDEACTQLIRASTQEGALTVVIDPRVEDVTVRVTAVCADDEGGEVLKPGDFSWHVLTSLVDDVQTFRDGYRSDAAGVLCGVTLVARRADAIR